MQQSLNRILLAFLMMDDVVTVRNTLQNCAAKLRTSSLRTYCFISLAFLSAATLFVSLDAARMA